MFKSIKYFIICVFSIMIFVSFIILASYFSISKIKKDSEKNRSYNEYIETGKCIGRLYI